MTHGWPLTIGVLFLLYLVGLAILFVVFGIGLKLLDLLFGLEKDKWFTLRQFLAFMIFSAFLTPLAGVIAAVVVGAVRKHKHPEKE
jgi:hypothetical protein